MELSHETKNLEHETLPESVSTVNSKLIKCIKKCIMLNIFLEKISMVFDVYLIKHTDTCVAGSCVNMRIEVTFLHL